MSTTTATILDTIVAKGGLVLSESTLDTADLLVAYYDFLVENDLNETLRQEIRNCFTEEPTAVNRYYGMTDIREEKEDDAMYLLNEDVVDFFNNIAPENFCFSSSEGDGACFGFFPIG